MASALTNPKTATSDATKARAHIVAALEVRGAMLCAQEAYQAAIENYVFPTVDVPNSTEAKADRRRLLSPSATAILARIWTASDHVTEGEVLAAGLPTSQAGGPLTCRGLAKALAQASGQPFDKVHQEVKRLVAAAVVYGLVEKTCLASNCVKIEGTVRLHELMMKLATDEMTILSEQVGLQVEAVSK